MSDKFYFHLAINGEDQTKEPCKFDASGNTIECGGITIANQELYLEIWMPFMPYTWGGALDCNSNYTVDKLTSTGVSVLAVGMEWDVTLELPWIDNQFEVGHTDFYVIKSAYDFEAYNCNHPDSFYDCFSGVEKISNASRWPDFEIIGQPG